MEANELKEDRKINCPVCKQSISLRIAKGRKSGKPSVMFICPKDGRHLRAFITDKTYVQAVLDQLEKYHSKE